MSAFTAILSLNLLDKVSIPLKNVVSGFSVTSEAYKKNKKSLLDLQSQMGKIESYQKTVLALDTMTKNVTNQEKTLSDLTNKEKNHTTAIKEKSSTISKLSYELQKLKNAEGDHGEAIKSTSNQLKAEKLELKSLKEERKGIKDVLNLGQKELLKLNTEMTKTTELVTKQESALEKLGIDHKKAGEAADKMRQDEMKLNVEMAKQKITLDKIKESQEKLNKARANADKAEKSAANKMIVGRGMLSAGQGIFGKAMQPLNVAVDFQAKMSAVQAKSGATGEDLLKLKKIAMDLGAVTSFSASEVAGAQELLAMAGVETKDITKDLLSGLLDVSKAGQISLEQATSISTGVIRGFGLDLKDMSKVGDILAYTANTTNTSIAEMGEVFKDVAPVAKMAGISLKTMSSLTGVLANVNIRGSVAGTALKNTITSLAAPASAGGKALAALGVSAKKANGDMRDLPDILRDIALATKGMGKTERAEYLVHIAGKESLAGFAELIEKAGSEKGMKELKDVELSMNKILGTSRRMGEVLGDNAKGDIDNLSSSWEGLSIVLGDIMLPTFRLFVRSITQSITFMQGFAEKNPRVAKTLLGVAIGLGAVLTIGGSLVIGLAALQFSLAKVSWAAALMKFNLLGSLKSMAVGSYSSCISIVSGLGKMVTAFRALSFAGKLALASMGIGLIIAGGLLIYENWDKIKAFFMTMWEPIKPIWEGFAEFVKGVFGPIAEFIGGLFGENEFEIKKKTEEEISRKMSFSSRSGLETKEDALSMKSMAKKPLIDPKDLEERKASVIKYDTPINIVVNGNTNEELLAKKVRDEMEKSHKSMEVKHRSRLND